MSDTVKPKTKVWRKRSEGLALTTKGRKDLSGGKRLHLIVAISFVETFPLSLKSQVKTKHMDNDPSQTSAKSMATLMEMGYMVQKIAARSPDLNPIENVFHIAESVLMHR